MPQGRKTSEDIFQVVSRMLAAQIDVLTIMALTGVSKRQIQRIKAATKATGEPVGQIKGLETRGWLRTLTLGDIEVKTHF